MDNKVTKLPRIPTATEKKIQKARATYKIYCDLGTLEKTRETTGLAIRTIRKYIAITEELNHKAKLSSKDRYYNQEDIYNIYNNNINNNISNIKEDINNIGIDNKNKNIDNKEDIDINDIEVIKNNKIPSIKDVKNKILLSKLDTIAVKYLDYLDNPDEGKLRKTSLKDRAVIAGILLDKKILLEHKQADVIKNQSIIFNLFGSNQSLASFISKAMNRQKKLASKPTNKYLPASHNNTP
jgi:hypothetical protein